MELTNKEKFTELLNTQIWDNWINEEDKSKYWDLFEVFYCKLDWLKEAIEFNEELEEHIELLTNLQTVVQMLSEVKMNILFKLEEDELRNTISII